MIDLILFDLDGTLIDHRGAVLAGMWLDRGVEPFTGKAPDQARAVAADLSVARIEHLTELTAAV